MSLNLIVALAAVATTPAKEPNAAKPTVEAVAPAKAKPAMDPMQSVTMMMNMFDKMFPAGPEPDPARLALARDATMTMFPKGTYGEAISGFMNGMVDRGLNMSEADFMAMFPQPEPKKGEKAKTPSTEPLRLMLAKKEPNFDAKLAAVRAFADVMIAKFGDVAEPRFREGMSRSLARKFDTRQLEEIRAFLATPTGAAYGREMVGLWFEPEVIRGTFQMFPDLMKMMPEVMKDGAALDAQMKALDKAKAGKKD